MVVEAQANAVPTEQPQGFDAAAFLTGRNTEVLGGKPNEVASPIATQQSQVEAPAPVSAASVAAAEAEAAFNLTLSQRAATRLTERLGVTEENPLTEDRLLEYFDAIERNESTLRAQLVESGVYDSEVIKDIEKTKALSKEDAVKQHLIALGLDEEDAATRVEILESTGGIDSIYNKYVTSLDAKKQVEIDRLKAENAQAIDKRSRGLNGSMSQEEAGQLTTLLNEQLKDVSTIAGVSFGSTPEEAQASKAAHVEYLVSGKFEKDLRENPTVYAQMAFVFKNLKTIQSVAISKGAELGKAAILSKIQNPTIPKSGQPPVPNGSGAGFDPVAFNQGRQEAQANK
jgi:hypothetical protein